MSEVETVIFVIIWVVCFIAGIFAEWRFAKRWYEQKLQDVEEQQRIQKEHWERAFQRMANKAIYGEVVQVSAVCELSPYVLSWNRCSPDQREAVIEELQSEIGKEIWDFVNLKETDRPCGGIEFTATVNVCAMPDRQREGDGR